jgi:hypothetical protein
MSDRSLKLLKEPLVQFLVLGALVFAVDQYVIGRADDPRRIVFDDERYQELVDIFVSGQGRKPTEDEIQELIIQWTQNEVLYREALAMDLDKGDEMIRQRLILKTRDILFNNVVAELPPEAELEAWFEANRVAYDRPELVDFEQFLVADLDAESAGDLAIELATEPHPEAYDDAFRRYPHRPPSNLVAVFGEAQAERLLAAPEGSWVPVKSEYGWHLARITQRQPGDPAEFGEVRHQVVSDWLDMARKRDLAAALNAIVEEYDFRYTVTEDAVEGTLLTAGLDAEEWTR